jgi:hypothetical protein
MKARINTERLKIPHGLTCGAGRLCPGVHLQALLAFRPNGVKGKHSRAGNALIPVRVLTFRGESEVLECISAKTIGIPTFGIRESDTSKAMALSQRPSPKRKTEVAAGTYKRKRTIHHLIRPGRAGKKISGRE